MVKLKEEMHAQGQGNENADPEGICTYIDVQKLPAVTAISPFMPKDITQPARVRSATSKRLNAQDRLLEVLALTLGLDDVINTHHDGHL
jgi:hypothetical protein